MAYKFRSGKAELSGSMTTDDIMYKEDTDTGINFGPDTIKLETDSTARFEVSNDSLKAMTNLAVDTNSQPAIEFKESGSDRAEIKINDSDNLLITNQSTNKHIVFKSNDNGVIREGLRVGGVQPEVVVNEGSDSLVDFRVESDNKTHMLYVDGSLDRVGINKSSPESSLHIGGSLSLNLTNLNAGNDPGTTYSCTVTDCVILINTRPTAQGGIDSTLSITLPDCASAAGRVLIIKDAGGYSDVNSITINRQGSDQINGNLTSLTLNNAGGFKKLRVIE